VIPVSQVLRDRQEKSVFPVLKVCPDMWDYLVCQASTEKMAYQDHRVNAVQSENPDHQGLWELLVSLVLQDHLENLVRRASLGHLAVQDIREKLVHQVNKGKKDLRVQ
jgi:hypothetical protein